MARARSLRPFYETLAEHRRQLDRLVDRRALPRLKALYDEAHDLVARRLRRELRAGHADEFTAHQQRILLAQLRTGQAALARRLAGELGDVTAEAQTEAVRGLARGITRLEKTFTGADVVVPIDEAWRLRQLVGRRRAYLDDMHARSISRWGGRLFARVHEVTSQALAANLTTDEAIELIPKEAAAQWWQGERIVRTEMSWASNLSQADAIEEAGREIDDLEKRWTEHVDDETYEPLDDRVAPDSIAMHGQIVEPDGEFGFPSDADDMDAKEVQRMQARAPWVAPPNRPNDRATIQPWRPSWGIPAWRLVGGRRVWV